MSETVAGAVEQVAAPKMITPERWAEVLPAHLGAEKFNRWALTLLQRPELAAVARTDEGRLSVISALLDCATLGLEPGRTYHLVPFEGKNKDGSPKPATVTGIVDYKGEIELITNANPSASVVAMLVREKDDFHMTGANVPPRHDADWFGDRGEIAGGYAYVDFGGRCSQVVRMSEADFLKHRDKARSKNVWDTWPESMRLKTLIHQLHKWVPWSAEVRDQR